ncbi:hypothetical protein [Aliarcobacter butzleri]|uniref:hypothetical protein n=1 Tax=Aliarcobacter butzleri TaxID=28197 RepID=UPI00263E10C2|nr:hypothetical protein [Aliarcobacter butzleri]MDN5082239.1 hypothetical protein [Aliarcobacter butzleri]MDN5084079.1 hypothetical protein [Aliarcobacter butzleri]
MPYQTDERLKSYLDTNQLHREQMCRAVLATDKRFSDVRPRHPRGGPDGGRDIQAIYRENQTAFGAVGFVNQANDSEEQKKTIKKKFNDDLESAISADKDLKVFIFFTNINLTIGDKDTLIEKAKKEGILYCDVLDRERIRITLDSPDGFSIRFQYLNITLTEEEQASFFSRWGDDIQSLISTGFQKIEGTLNRVLFLQEANDPISSLTISFELNKMYDAEEIGHFRVFCYLTLKEPKHNILSILFGSSDKSNRMRGEDETVFSKQKSGIKYGVSSGQWEKHINLEANQNETEDSDEVDKKWTKVSSGSSIGREKVEFLSISYSKSGLIRFFPVISLRDLDEAMFLPFVNKSLVEKIKAIHIYSNGYKLQEISLTDIDIDTTAVNPNFPIQFDEEEIKDQWVRIRSKESSAFHMRFFENTPKRLFASSQVEDSLEVRHNNA